MSSHREAPSISKDPAADNTDTYAWVTPGNTVTIVSNYLPSEAPAAGPNFFEFDDGVLYVINVDNNGNGHADVRFEFRFSTRVLNHDTFLYNTGPITSIHDTTFNRPQHYTLTMVKNGVSTVLGSGLKVPPCNIGPRSIPNYQHLANQCVETPAAGVKVFCGQRADPFFVDLGSIFDLGTLRPFESLHLIPTPNQPGRDSLKTANVHSIAIQVPISMLTRDGSTPTNPAAPKSVIGVWASASRQRGRIQHDGVIDSVGPWEQVSRLGNPLFNEVIVPMARKDYWNSVGPDSDDEFAGYVAQPELAKLLPVLYPNVFPNLAAYSKDRADLEAILLTGIPSGIIPGFQNYTGTTQADMLRLNVAIPPASSPNRLGLLGGDLAGFPNGRRLTDDIVTIELRAVAGVTIPLVDPSFTPDGAAGVIEDGTFDNPGRDFSASFPYMGSPYSGYDVPAS